MAIVGRTPTVVEDAAATTTITGTLPTDRQTGDLCVAVFAGTVAAGTITGPSGWTQLIAPTSTGSSPVLAAAYYRFDPPSDPVLTTSGTLGRATAIVQAYGGVDPTTPIDVTAAVTTGSAPLACTGVTTVTPGALLLSGAASDTSSRTMTEPGTMTSVAEYSATTVGRAGALAQEFRPSTGATGTRTWDVSPASALSTVGFVGALRPAAMTGTITATASLAGDLTVGMSGSASATASLSGSLLLGIGLSGTVGATASLTGDLTVTSRVFTGTLEIEFTAGVWTDVTSNLTFRSGPLRIRQGRTTEFDAIGPGQLFCTLENIDGRFMPDNTTSPYYPNVADGKRIRWKVTKSSVTYTRFVGWIQGIVPDFPGNSTHQATVAISAVDALGVLQQRKLRSNFTEQALVRARLDTASIEMYEAYGKTTGFIANLTNFSTDAARSSSASAASVTDPQLTFESTTDASVGDVVSSHGNGQSAKVICFTRTGLLQFVIHIKTPATAPAGSVTLLTLGSASVCHLAVVGGNVVLRNGTNTATLGTFAALPLGQWLRFQGISNSGTPANSDWTMTRQDGTTSSFTNVAADVRNIDYVVIPGATGTFTDSSYGGLMALGSRTTLSWQDSFNGAAGRSLATRLSQLQNVVSPLGVTISTLGTFTGDVATGAWSSRTATEVLQEMVRTWDAIAWARSRDSTVYAVDAANSYPTSPVAVVDTDADCSGPPRLALGAEAVPTRVEVESPAGIATSIDTTAELAGKSRSQRFSSVAATLAQAQAVADAIRGRANGRLRISRIVVDLVTGDTDHTDTLFDEGTTLGALFPTVRARTIVPTSHFGVPTRDHYVQGWEEAYHPQYVTVALDTSPAVAATLISEVFTGSNGSGFSGTSFVSRVDIGGAGSALIQSNRGRITTAAASTAACFARFNTTADDLEFVGTFQLQASGSRAAVICKSAGIAGTGYIVRVGTSGTAELIRSGSVVATWSETLSASTDYKIRLRAAGGYVNARVWAAAGSEPGTWDLAYVDSSPLSGTQSAIGAYADGSTATARAVDWDDVTITTMT